VRAFCEQGGLVLQMWTSALYGAKNIRFFEIYGVSARTGGGLSQCEHFADKERGSQFFAILCERPLSTAPNKLLNVKLMAFQN